MNNFITDHIETLLQEGRVKELNTLASKMKKTLSSESSDIDEFEDKLNVATEYFFTLLSGRDYSGKAVKAPAIEIEEALNKTDISVVLKRALDIRLQTPTEPNLFLQNSVAQVIDLPWDAPITMSFVQVGTLIAEDVSYNQPYPNSDLSWAENTVSVTMRKTGITASIGEEIIRESQWPLIDMYVTAMSAAIRRRVEQKLKKVMVTKANVVKDNESLDTALHTSGVDSANDWNATYDFRDTVHMFTNLLHREKNASHVLSHPLAWSVFAQDPMYRNIYVFGGQAGANPFTQTPNFNQQSMMPFGLQYVPYYAVDYKPSAQLAAGVGSSLAATMITDVYMIDRAESLILLKRGDVEMDDMADWHKDATQLKARLYNDVAAKDMGRGMVVTKNVRIAENFRATGRYEVVSL